MYSPESNGTGMMAMTDQTFHEPTFTAALDRAETIIASHTDYGAQVRRKAMNDLYRSLMIVTDHQPLDKELRRLSAKLDALMDLPDEGKAISAWDTALKRYERMRDNQWRVLEVMRRDREL